MGLSLELVLNFDSLDAACRASNSVCGQGSGEFGPRSNIELAIDVRQVGFDGALAHEQPGGDLGVGVTGDDQIGDSALGAGQVCAGRTASSAAKTDSGQLLASQGGPQGGVKPLEGLSRGPKAPAGLALVLGAAIHLPGDEKGAGFFEGKRDLAMRDQCRFEGSLGAR
jgi:hypothetical protein